MTSDEAKQALKEGKTITWKAWNNDSYLKIETHIIFNGHTIADDVFEDDDTEWEILE